MTTPNRFRFRAWSPTSREMLIFDLFTARQLLTREPLDWIKMQSTGLADRHGVEIFEGDVLAFKNEWMKAPKVGPVSWCDVRACFLFDQMPFEYFDNGQPEPEKLEILGNIWENPELLKATVLSYQGTTFVYDNKVRGS